MKRGKRKTTIWELVDGVVVGSSKKEKNVFICVVCDEPILFGDSEKVCISCLEENENKDYKIPSVNEW